MTRSGLTVETLAEGMDIPCQASSNPNGLSFVSLTVKPVGKPDARNGHLRFDERDGKCARRASVSTRVNPQLQPYAMVMWSSILVTPGAAQAACMASSYSARERAVPRRLAIPWATCTLI